MNSKNKGTNDKTIEDKIDLLIRQVNELNKKLDKVLGGPSTFDEPKDPPPVPPNP